MSQITINGIAYAFEPGETLYECVSRHLGDTEIPVLCHDPALEPFGACRICLVEVARDKGEAGRLMASCHTPAADGLHISTRGERLNRVRKGILELLLSNYPQNKLEPAADETPSLFQRLLRERGIIESRYPLEQEPGKPAQPHTYLRFDPAECIHCYRCIRACDEVQGQFVLSMVNRGIKSHIIQGLTGDFGEAGCVSCGRCVQTCPTNALSDRYRAKTLRADHTVQTVCTYCGVGCNLEVKVKQGRVSAISAIEDAEVNWGHTCLKGRYAFEYVHHPDRLTSPMIRRDAELVEVSWDEALDYIAQRLAAIRHEHGPDAIAAISSARCTNEENYLMQKFMRAVIGNNNIDGCARVCHSPTAFGMQQVYGTGAATNSIGEIPLADCLLVFGANPTEAHPVTGARLKQAAIQGADLIIVDPRRSELSKYAACHLQPRPGSNVALLNMLCRYLIELGYVDQAFVASRTEGFEEFSAKVMAQDLDQLEKTTGVSREDARHAAEIYGRSQCAMAFHGLGITEHYQGSRAIMMLASLIMMTGNIGRPGTGMNPLRGQNNVQGAVDMGVQPDFGAGYLDYKQPEIRAQFEKIYGTEIPTQVGLKIPQMFSAAREGKLKALWIMGEDILQTDPNSCEVKYSLNLLDLLIVQELFMTETCSMADVILPASSSLEKSGTFTNGERRIQKVNAAIGPLRGTRPDGEIVCNVMERMGYPQGDYDPAELLKEISQIVPFFAGVTWENLEGNGKQWPVAADGTDTKILHQQRFTLPKGRFRFFEFQETPELLDHSAEFPYILTTSRRLEHYNCGSMTRRTPNLELVDHDVLLVNPADAAREGITDGSRVEIQSSNGVTHLNVQVSDEVKPGVLFTTFHFPEIAINHLTSGIFDQESMTPEYKVVAVRLVAG
ncbi:formate dehydrogenase subunit alpha [endosymbiont of Lamellibrachia barhami]|uniref:formate dehydrogenase subunit alpha n=1 Tax=endosymbiont of Lamellibrachia barhami TaxID=205975 RepID=UPI0015ACDB01|nr:formate dehydrogenase subunit alpha [endosymbiont of Lamellibrachia barhami]